MKGILIAIGFIAIVASSFALGWSWGSALNFTKQIRQNGWTRKHHNIYQSAIGTLNKIVRAHDLDAPMEFRVVQLPDNLRADAQDVIDRYREEIDA